MLFIINDNKKKLKKCKDLKTETKQAAYRITRLNLLYIIGTKEHSDCIFPSELWERISFN